MAKNTNDDLNTLLEFFGYEPKQPDDPNKREMNSAAGITTQVVGVLTIFVGFISILEYPYNLSRATSLLGGGAALCTLGSIANHTKRSAMLAEKRFDMECSE